MIRAFFAISLPPEFKEEIARLQGLLKSTGADIKWVRPESVHLTLKFLGQTAEDIIDPLTLAAAEKAARVPALSLVLNNTGVFPNSKRPRVAWLGLGGDLDNVLKIQRGIDKAAAGFGFDREKRKFKPHLTLGRIKPGRVGGDFMAELDRLAPKPLEFTATEVTLFKSDLKPGGAIYPPLKKIHLSRVPTED